MSSTLDVVDNLIAEINRLREENAKLQKHIDEMSCCCAGCTKHNQDLKNDTDT